MFSTRRGATSALESSAESLSHISISCQRRYLSGRKISYPPYPFSRLTSTRKAKHDSNLKYAMRQFLGPKNFKGEYIYNRYFAVPNNHEPKYIRPEVEKGEALVDPVTGKKVLVNPDNTIRVTEDLPPKNLKFRQLQPFPGNKFCTTNVVLSEDTRQSIYHMLEVEKKSAQEVSRTFNLKIPRIEAVAKLVALEKKMEKHNRISPETSKIADVMYKMFPVFDVKHKENLSEIPVPAKALSSRILTIAESQPFGPIDAAKMLELEPAAETLDKLGRLGDHSANHSEVQKSRKVVYGEVLEGDRFKFRFVSKPVGQVGFRYGSGNRDNRKDRKIGFDKLGRMVYL